MPFWGQMLHKRSLVVDWYTRTKTEAYREVEVPLSQGVVGLQEGATLGDSSSVTV